MTIVIEHEIANSVDTTLRWVNGWACAQIDSGCGTGAIDLTVADLRALSAAALEIAAELEARQ